MNLYVWQHCHLCRTAAASSYVFAALVQQTKDLSNELERSHWKYICMYNISCVQSNTAAKKILS